MFNPYSNFCLKAYEAWKEDHSIFIKQEFCPYGDLLDYLQKLELNKINLCNEFYWDLIFEMLCVINTTNFYRD